MKIKRGLELYFVLIVLFITIIAFIGFFSLTKFGESVNEVLGKEYSASTIVFTISNNLLESRLKLNQYLFTGNKAHLQELSDLFLNTNQTLSALSALQKQEFEKEQLGQVREAFDSYQLLIQSVLSYYEMNPEDMETLNLKLGRLDAFLENALLLKLEYVHNAHYEGMIVLASQVQKIKAAYLLVMIMSYVILLSGILLLDVIISRTITRPIDKMKQALFLVSKGELNQRVLINSRDEFGELASSFNKMTRDLQLLHEKIMRHEAELERVVKERTGELRKKVKELTDTKTAVLNMLEDTNASKEDLEKSHSELEKLNKEFREANAELRKSEEYKNQFISITAHELKTPLASIHGFAGLLQNKKILSNPKQRNYYLDIIQQDSERLKKIIDDILDLSRLDLGTMKFMFEEVDLREIFKSTMKEMYVLASKSSLMLKMDVAGNVPNIISDKSRLSQILVNLVNNAIKYTPKKGGKIIVRAERKGRSILFSIKDTGIGIPESAAPKIFQRFYQVDSWLTRKVGGSGLGLSICKGIVEAMGGKIWFKSKVNKGSIFYFTLPIKSKSIVAGEKELEVLSTKG